MRKIQWQKLVVKTPMDRALSVIVSKHKERNLSSSYIRIFNIEGFCLPPEHPPLDSAPFSPSPRSPGSSDIGKCNVTLQIWWLRIQRCSLKWSGN